MKVLQLYYKLPFPMNDGGAYAIYHSSLAMLSQGIDLKILAMDLVKSPGDKEKIPVEFTEQTKFESVMVDNRIKPREAFFNLFGRSSYFVERFYSVAFSKTLKDLLQNNTFDVIQLEHLYLGLYLDVIRGHSSARIVLRAQNVEHALWFNYLQKVNNPFVKFFLSIAAKRLEVFERKMSAGVDGIMALSENDARYFKHGVPKTKVTAIPIGLNLDSFSVVDNQRPQENFPALFHLGSMDWKPNVLGMKWFIQKVWPLVKKEYPGIRFVIAGKNMPGWFFRQADKNLVVYGKIEDALRFQEDKAILIVPLLAGSGIRVKILEGMALGKAIISTSIGASGIAYKDGENILIANSPEEFVKQIGRCLKSEAFCKSLGKNAQRLVAEKYELNKTGTAMLEFYESLTQPICIESGAAY
jgi:glycosyltransferase involved in cell wall biosynthesis